MAIEIDFDYDINPSYMSDVTFIYYPGSIISYLDRQRYGCYFYTHSNSRNYCLWLNYSFNHNVSLDRSIDKCFYWIGDSIELVSIEDFDNTLSRVYSENQAVIDYVTDGFIAKYKELIDRNKSFV